jgi:hypothetical protein
VQALGAQQLIDASLATHVIGHVADLADELTKLCSIPGSFLGPTKISATTQIMSSSLKENPNTGAT